MDLRSERSLSALDERHRLVVSGILESAGLSRLSSGAAQNLFAGWTLSPIITWSSGRPFNLLAGYDANGDSHADTDRPTLVNGGPVGRNTGIGPSFMNVDARLSRKLQFKEKGSSMELMIEAFNVFNKVNYSGVNSVTGAMRLESSRVRGSSRIAPNQPLGFTASFPARQLQIGGRFRF